MKNVVRYLRKVAVREGADSRADGDLLEAFLARRDEAAFETLLRRHGPMVLGVCRRTLRNPHDAEDAFQATFLVLVRKASTIRPREMVGNWLYGVACRTAKKARAMNMKRRIKERKVASAVLPEDLSDCGHAEILKHLDAEISRLPNKYRAPVVLCELEGKSRKEAARLLGLPEGTLSWRLAWARKTLARRLARRGIPLSAGALTAALAGPTASAGVPPMLLSSTARAAFKVAAGQTLTAGAVSAQVVTLTEGVLKAMFLSKLKVLWAVALTVSIGAGATGLAYQAAAAQPGQTREAQPGMRRAFDELEELRLEVAALRKGLDATRERVKTLETEVDTLKRLRPARSSGMPGMGGGMGGGGLGGMGGLGGQGFAGGGGFSGGGFSGAGQGFRGSTGGGSGSSAGGQGFAGGGGFSGAGKEFRGSTSGSSSSADSQGFGTRSSKGPANQQGAARPTPAADPLGDAEKALKELRQHPDNKQAADQLEKAVQWLKQRPKPKEEPQSR